MNEFDKAQAIFNNTIDANDYFDSFSAEETKKKLFEVLNSDDIHLTFLIGEPGVGKTFMLNFIEAKLKKRKNIIFFKDPLLTKNEFFKKLITHINKDEEVLEDLHYGDLKEIALKLYKNVDNAVFIDEAQLMTDEQFEMVRILSDTKIFRFVLSLHKKDKKRILKNDYFKSRSHLNITLEPLQHSEVQRYVQNKLLNHSLGEISSMFEKSHFDMIAKLTNRNFRTLKRYMSTLFELLSYIKDNNLRQYRGISKKLLIMAAIDTGLIDVK